MKIMAKGHMMRCKVTSRFLLPIFSSRQIDESISFADFFPPNYCRFFLPAFVESLSMISSVFPPN
jgi:hypothetical protein